jgi:hypothetical protein
MHSSTTRQRDVFLQQHGQSTIHLMVICNKICLKTSHPNIVHPTQPTLPPLPPPGPLIFDGSMSSKCGTCAQRAGSHWSPSLQRLRWRRRQYHLSRVHRKNPQSVGCGCGHRGRVRHDRLVSIPMEFNEKRTEVRFKLSKIWIIKAQ